MSLSLIVESPKTTEEFTEGDLAFVLWYLKYNINAQAPNFRQLTLSCMKKVFRTSQIHYWILNVCLFIHTILLDMLQKKMYRDHYNRRSYRPWRSLFRFSDELSSHLERR